MNLNKLLIVFLLMPSLAFAETEADVCFFESTAKEIVVEVEKCRILKEQNELYKQGTLELEKQLELLNKLIEAKDAQIKILQETGTKYQELLQQQKESCDKLVAESKPGFLKVLLQALGFIGLGVLLGIAL